MADSREHSYHGEGGFGYGGDPTMGNYGPGGQGPAIGGGYDYLTSRYETSSYYHGAGQQQHQQHHSLHHPGAHHHRTAYDGSQAAPESYAYAYPHQQLQDPIAPPLPNEPPPPPPPPLPDEAPPLPHGAPPLDGGDVRGWHPLANRPLNFRDWREFQNTGESNNQKKKRWHAMDEARRAAELLKVEGWLRERLAAEQQLHQQHQYHQEQHGQHWGQQQHDHGGGYVQQAQQQSSWDQHACWQKQHQHENQQQWPQQQPPQHPPDSGRVGIHHQAPPSSNQRSSESGPSAGEALWQQHHKEERDKQQQGKQSQQPKGGGSKKGANQHQKKHENHPQAKDDKGSGSKDAKKTKKGGGDNGAPGLQSAMSALKSLSNRWAGKDGEAGDNDDALEEGEVPSAEGGGNAAGKEHLQKEKKMSKNARKRAKRKKKAEERKRALMGKVAEVGSLGEQQQQQQLPVPPLQQQQQTQQSSSQSRMQGGDNSASAVATVDLTDGVIDLTTPPETPASSMRLVSNEPVSTASREWQQWKQQGQTGWQHQGQSVSQAQMRPQSQEQPQPHHHHAPLYPAHQGGQEEMDISEDERSAAGIAGGIGRAAAAYHHHHQTPPVSDFTRPIPTTGYRPISSEIRGFSSYDGGVSAAGGSREEAEPEAWRRQEGGHEGGEEDELRAIWTAAAVSAGRGDTSAVVSADSEAATVAVAGSSTVAAQGAPAPLLAPASVAPSAAMVAEALAEKRERLARALKKAKLEKAKAELRAAQKRREDLLKAKLKQRGVSLPSAKKGGSAVTQPTVAQGEEMTRAVASASAPAVSPPPPPLPATHPPVATKKAESLLDLSALRASNLLILNISASGAEDQIRVFRTVAGPYQDLIEEEGQIDTPLPPSAEGDEREEVDVAKRQQLTAAGSYQSEVVVDKGEVSSLDTEIKRKKAEALKAKMELLKRKMKLMEQKERLKKRQRTTEGEEPTKAALLPATETTEQEAALSPERAASPIVGAEEGTGSAVEVGDIGGMEPKLMNDKVDGELVERVGQEAERGTNFLVESITGDNAKDKLAKQQQQQPRPQNIEDLRRRQLELKRTIEASAASQRQNRHNREVSDLRDMVNKQRRLLSQQGTKLSESASSLRRCEDDVATEERALEKSERSLEELLRRKRILESMVIKVTRKLMSGRRRRDELLGVTSGEGGQEEIISARTRQNRGNDQSVADGGEIPAPTNGRDPLGRSLRKRKGCAKAADFF